MKKIILFLSAMFMMLCVGTARAAGESAASMVWVNPSCVSDITEAEGKMNAGLQKTLAHYQFQFIDSVQAQMAMEQYMIENGVVPDDNKTSVGFLPKKADLKAIAEDLGVKYVVFCNARITDEKEKVAWMSWTGSKYEVTVLFTTIVYSTDQDRYVFFNQMSVKENAAGTSSTERAFKKACESYFNKKLTPDVLVLK